MRNSATLSRTILDGGDCRIGLESTIVSCVDDVPRLLRPGFITLTQLCAVVPGVEGRPATDSPRVPGSDVKHYAPATPLSIVTSATLEEVVGQLTADGSRVAVLATRPPRTANKYMTWVNAGRRADAYARELYVGLRALDKSGASQILVEEVPEGEAWDAVRDRLHRAASAENVVAVDQDIAALRAEFGDGDRAAMTQREARACALRLLDHVAGARQARGIAVVIDVFRAFSVAPHAFDAGAERVFPVGEVDDAFELGRRFPGAILAGERHARRLPGFNAGNSPTEIRGAGPSRQGTRAHDSRGHAGAGQRVAGRRGPHRRLR